MKHFIVLCIHEMFHYKCIIFIHIDIELINHKISKNLTERLKILCVTTKIYYITKIIKIIIIIKKKKP